MKKLRYFLVVSTVLGAIWTFRFFLFQSEVIKTTSDSSPAFVEKINLSSKKPKSEITEIQKNEQLDFQDLLDQKFKSLTIVDDLQQLTEGDVHFTPEIIKDSGGVIGQIHDEAQNNPTKRVQAMQFFKRCSEDQELVPAIRAVCLNKIYLLIPIWKIPVDLSDELISKEVLDLASKLR